MIEINWAPRISPEKIRRVYESESKGLLDLDLLEKVGYSLLARCKDILEVSDAISGKIHCRRCGWIIMRSSMHKPDEDDETLRCLKCSWEITWDQYFRSFSGRKLRGGEVVHVYRQYIDEWEKAKSPQEKMLTIDRLIHEFHTYLGKPTKSVAVTVISGSSTHIYQLIEDLALGTGNPD